MKESFPYKAIVAVSEDGVIGRGGDLPWRLSGDLKWFKKIMPYFDEIFGSGWKDTHMEDLKNLNLLHNHEEQE